MLPYRSDHPECLVWKVRVRHQPEAGESKGHRRHGASAVPGQGLQTHPHRVLQGVCIYTSLCPFDHLKSEVCVRMSCFSVCRQGCRASTTPV